MNLRKTHLCIMLLLAIAFNPCNSASITITEISSADPVFKAFADDPYMHRWSLKIVKAFRWSYMKNSGTLFAVSSHDPEQSDECTILSGKTGRPRLVANSQLQHKCIWDISAPKITFFRNRLTLVFDSKIDLIGSQAGYLPGRVEIHYDYFSKDFCMQEFFENRCVEY